MPVQHARSPGQAQRASSPVKNHVTSKSPVGDISVVTLTRTDTTLDHGQKAETVCLASARGGIRLFLQKVLTLLHESSLAAVIAVAVVGSRCARDCCESATSGCCWAGQDPPLRTHFERAPSEGNRQPSWCDEAWDSWCGRRQIRTSVASERSKRGEANRGSQRGQSAR